MNVGEYHPQSDLLTGLRRMEPLPLLPWDDYYMAMAQTDYMCNTHLDQVSKTFFIREAPFGGSYALLGGLTALIRIINDYRFNASVANALTEQGYETEFIKYLIHEHSRLSIKIFAPPEGSVILPHEPAIVMEGDKLSLRIAEGILLREVNFPTLSLTKWHRIVMAAGPGSTLEFARRRAQDDLRTSLYAHLGGCKFSSNSNIRCGFDIPIRGTMGHEWIQSIGDEYQAFDIWLAVNPRKPVLLVDTIDTLRSGVPNAIRAFKKHEEQIKASNGVFGIRLDSGDLAYLSIEARRMLDEAGLSQVLIYMTNDLDEYLIQSIREQIFTYAQRAGLDPVSMIARIVWAAGTRPGTCFEQPSLGGVAKLTSIERAVFDTDSEEPKMVQKAVIKLAGDNVVKTSIPGSNRSTFVWHGNDLVCCVVHGREESPALDQDIVYSINDITKFIGLDDPSYRFEPRQKLMYDSLTTDIAPSQSLEQVRSHVKAETERLHWTHKRFEKPHSIKLSLSRHVFTLRQKLIKDGRLIEE